MPVFEVEDSRGHVIQIEGDREPDAGELSAIFMSEFPTQSVTPVAPPPGGQVLGRQLEAPTALTAAQVPSMTEQALQAIDQKQAQNIAEFEKTGPIRIGEQPITIPRVGKEGTLLRGASEAVAGLAEFPLNKPEEALAMLWPPTAAAVAARYTPEIITHFLTRLGDAALGDDQALGEVAGLSAMLGLPIGARQLAKARKMRLSRLAFQRGVETLRARDLIRETAEAMKVAEEPSNKPAPVAPERATLPELPTEPAASEAGKTVVAATESAPAISETTTKPSSIQSEVQNAPAVLNEARSLEDLPYDGTGGKKRMEFIQRTSVPSKKFDKPINGDDTWVSEVYWEPSQYGGQGGWRAKVQTPTGEKMYGSTFAESYNNPDFAAAKALSTHAATKQKRGRLFDFLNEIARLSARDRITFKLPGNSLSFSSKRKVQNAIQEQSAAAVDVRQPPGDGQTVAGRNAQEETPSVTSQTQEALAAGKEVLEQAEPVSVPAGQVEPAGAPIIGMGGAVPGEFQPPRGTPTSNKNAVVDAERQQRGLQPMMAPQRRTWGEVWDQAMAKIDQDPSWQDRLVKELLEDPRPVSDVENAALVHRRVDLKNEFEKAARDAIQAYEDGRMEDMQIANERTAMWSDRLSELERVTGKGGVGTETARGLRSRGMMVNEDFTLASLELRKRAANGFRQLTNDERAELIRIADEHARVAKELETKLAEERDLRSKAEAAKALAEIQAAQKRDIGISDYVLKTAEKWVAQWDKAADKARKNLAGKFLSPTPEDLYNLALIARADIAHIGLDLAKWTAKAVAEFGEGVRPYVAQAFADAQKMIDDMVAKIPQADRRERVRATVTRQPKESVESMTAKLSAKIEKEGASSIGPLVRKLAKMFVAEGSRTVEDLVDKVHGVVSELLPDITRRDVMDAISGYGDYKLLSKDEISVQLRDLKGQMQQLAKLEDMAAGKAPLKTGTERRTPSDTERRLIAEVNEAKKASNFTATDPATQLKSALDTVKTRIRNQISDLEDRIAREDYAQKKRTPPPENRETVNLRYQLEMVRRKFYEGVFEDSLKHRTTPKRIYDTGVQALNTARAIQTGLDLSAVLRQGKFLVVSHPFRSSRALKDMFRAMASEKGAFQVEHDILTRDNYLLYRRSKLYLAEHNAKNLSAMEEAYMSRWAAKIPGVSHSQRAYIAFLNRLRADAFDAMAATLGKGGKVTLEEAKVISNYINVMTGRGTFGMNEGLATSLNTFFFAPRFVASRFQALLGQPLYYGVVSGKVPFAVAKRARLMVANEYARIIAGMAVLYGLGLAAGGQIEWDRRTTKGLKLQFGKTFVDPLAGVQQATVLLTRLITGKTKNFRGDVSDIRGKVPFGKPTAWDIIGRFARTKFSPVFGAAMDLATGQDVMGNEVTPAQTFGKLLVPITLGDVAKILKENDWDTGLAMTLLAIFGENIQVYDNQR